MSVLHLLSPLNFLAVGLGAAFGAWARWLLGLALNPLFIALPLGTLAANLLGGYLVGVAVGVFHLNTHFPLAWKLFAITGFLGGLTSRLKSSNVCWLAKLRWPSGWRRYISPARCLLPTSACSPSAQRASGAEQKNSLAAWARLVKGGRFFRHV